jgi:uncharacterized protein YecE (DUF72 family)
MSGGKRRIGTAGWTIPRRHAEGFPGEGSHLQRYARVFNAAEINSSFHRPHARTTYERWAAAVPGHFRFGVKVPREITHTQRLVETEAALDAFARQVSGLGERLGPLLVQLPPSLPFEPSIAASFFAALRSRFEGPAVCEPRHATWFAPEGDELLIRWRIARVAADPARAPRADEPGGWPDLQYFRLHGSPRVYFSEYPPERIAHYAARLRCAANAGREVWCIFDNTASGAAAGNALALAESLALT